MTTDGGRTYAQRLFGLRRVDARALFAEFVGMALFVYTACGIASILSAPRVGAYGIEPFREVLIPDLIAHGGFRALTALGFGVSILVLAYAIGHVSGCHLNPSVSLALWLSGEADIGILQLVGNIACQCIGSIVGAALLLGTAPGPGTLGANVVAANVSNVRALLGETVMTFLLCLVVLLTVVDKANDKITPMAPIAIGLSVFLGNAFLIPIDGASLNFARSLGPAVVSGIWSTEQFGSTPTNPVFGPGRFWIFMLGPLLGALVSVPVWYALSRHHHHHRQTSLQPESAAQTSAGDP